jgi:hypothetical protein
MRNDQAEDELHQWHLGFASGETYKAGVAVVVIQFSQDVRAHGTGRKAQR